MNHVEIKLGDIATIGTGLVVKRKQAMDSSEVVKEYQMLTLKSFEQGGWLNTNELEVFKSNEELDEKYITKTGDVIVRLSSPNTAIAVNNEISGLLVPSLFAIVRVEAEYIDPEYLSVYLNSDSMKRIYARSSVGTAIQIIKTSMLKELVIPIQTLEKQKQIVEINKLAVRERLLLERLLDEKIKYHNMIMNKVFEI